jgi:hypothetical protein
MKIRLAFLTVATICAINTACAQVSKIVQQPQSVTNVAGSTASFSVNAKGVGPFGY